MSKKSTKLFSLFFTFAFVFFSFTGCSLTLTKPSNYYEGLFGGMNPNNFDNKPLPDVEWGTGGETYPSITYEQKQEALNEAAETYTGIRTVSVPVAGDESGYQQTDYERARFYKNVSDQYEILAKYILVSLVGQFGLGSDLTEIESSVYGVETTGDYVTSITTYQPENREDFSGYLGDTSERSIDRTVSGWVITDDGLCVPVENIATGEYTCPGQHTPEIVYTNDYAWKLNLVDEGDLSATEYLQLYLDKYLKFVQLRIIEIDLQQVATNYDSTNETVIDEKIKKYSSEISKLGVEITSDEQSAIINMIKNEVVGMTAINYDNSSKTFTEPTFIKSYNDSQVVHGYDINNNGIYGDTIVITPSNGFYCGFEKAINLVVPELQEIIKTFPDYYAMEICDVNPTDFYNIGEEVESGEKQVLNNIPQAEYKSVSFITEQEWFFDAVYIAVSADTDFILNLYLRVVVNGEEFTVKIGCLNVDSTKSWEYLGESEEESTDTSDEALRNELLDSSIKRNMLLVDLSVILSTEQLDLLYQGHTNSDLLKQNVYSTNENRWGYHTNSKNNTEVSPTILELTESLYINMLIENQKSTFALNNENNTFYEIIFDIEKEKETDKHPFTFLVWTAQFSDGLLET